MKNYVYTEMWAEDTKNVDGTYDVDDFVTAFIRTEGTTVTLNGAWDQNIGIPEGYIDFLGTKAGIRLTYGGEARIFGVRDGQLTNEVLPPVEGDSNMFRAEMRAFIDCIRTGKKLPSHIDYNIHTSKIMQGLYDSSEADREIVFG